MPVVRIAVAVGIIVAGALIARGFWHPGDGYRAPSVIPAQRDYHDPLQLSQAVNAHYHGQYSGCAKLPAGTYTCIVTANGAGASYTVTVSADGKSWSAS